MWQRHQGKTSPRNRPWLMLWVVPYLLLSLAGEALHNHQQPCSPDAAHGAHLNAAHDPGQPVSAVECLLCQWNQQASGALPSIVTLPLDASVTSAFATLNDGALRRSPMVALGRGPPLV